MVRGGIISFAHMRAYSYANAVIMPNAELVGVSDDEMRKLTASSFG